MSERDQCRSALEKQRAETQRKQQQADELEIRLTANPLLQSMLFLPPLTFPGPPTVLLSMLLIVARAPTRHLLTRLACKRVPPY